MGPGDPSDPYLDPSVPPWDVGGPAPFDASLAGPPPADPFAGLPPAPAHWYADQPAQDFGPPMGGPVDPYGAPLDVGPPQQGLGPPAAPPLAPPPGSVGDFPGLSFGTDAPPDLGSPAPRPPQLGGWDVDGRSAPPIPAQLPSELPPPPAAPGTQLPSGVAGPTITRPEAQYRQSVQDAHGDPFAIQSEPDRQRYLDEAARQRPQDFAGYLASDQERRAAYINERRKQRLADDEEAQRQNFEDRRAADDETAQKIAAVQDDAKRILNTKIDRTGGLNAFAKLGFIASAIVGGMVRGRTGSTHNSGLDMMNEAIKQGIAAQEGDLQRQKEGVSMRLGELGREYARHGDEFRSKEAIRQAAYSHMDELLATEAQQFDPRSKTALNLAATRAGISAAQQKSLMDFALQERERRLKERNMRREETLAEETLRHNRVSEAISIANIANDKANRRDAKDARREEREQKRIDDENERVRQFAIGGMPKLQVDDKGKPVVGTDGKPVIGYDYLRDSSGKPWLAPDAETQRELRQKKTSAAEVISIIDEIGSIRDRVGGESKLLNTEDAQRLEVLQARAKLLTKAGTQGMSSDKDMDTLSDAAGTSDAASWRSQAGRLREARARTVSSLNQALRDAKYTGPSLEFPQGSAAQNTRDDDNVQSLMQLPPVSREEAVRAEVNRRTLGWSPGEHSNQELYDVAHEANADVGRLWDEGATPDQQRRIAELGIIARGTDDAGKNARASLSKISSSADTGALRRFAGVALQEALGYGTDTPERTRGGSYDPSSLQRQVPKGETSRAVAVPPELRTGGR